METGWIKLHRKLLQGDIWLSEKFTKAQAWIDLFANANHNEGKFFVRGNEVRIGRGQIGWSELTMAKRWRWSKNKVRRFLNDLEMEQQIKQQKTFITSIITIVNYDRYQSGVQKTKQQKDSRRNTNKNDKNEKKYKREKTVAKATPQSEFFESQEIQNQTIDLLASKGISRNIAEAELKKFISYWTESNQHGKKRWQGEKFFDIKRRLATWFQNAKKFENKYRSPESIIAEREFKRINSSKKPEMVQVSPEKVEQTKLAIEKIKEKMQWIGK